MSGLASVEKDRLARAGFAPDRVAELSELAHHTPWLGQARWTIRHETALSLAVIFPLVAAGPWLFDRPAIWAFVVIVCSAHYWTLGLRRLLSRLEDPSRSRDRTLLALALRADPDDCGGRGAAFARLKERAGA